MQASGTALVAVVCLSLGCGVTSGGTSGSDQRGEAGSGAARGATDSSGGFAAAADDGDSGVVEVDGGGALGVGATGNAADDEQSRELGEDSVAGYEFPPHRLADFARCGDAQVQRGLVEACVAATSAPTILGSGAPAATVPMLKRGAAINGFTGMQTAGQIVGVPGEPGTLYVIGHRDGNVFTVQNGTVAATQLIKVDVANGGNNEQGLLSMALHPNFATNHLFYLFYTAAGGGAMTVDEFERTTPTTATKKQNIYTKARAGGGMFHNGGSITFNPKDTTPYLYFSVGNNESNDAGNASGDAGRVLRIDVGTKAATTYAYGLRNPYRMSIDRLTGDMYIADVANGPGGTIIFSAAGAAPGIDFLYRNNNGNPDVNDGILRDNNGAAIIGGFVYRGNKIPGLCGRYFYGNHSGGTVKSVVVQNGKVVGDTVTHTGLAVPGNITSFGEDGEGELYMASLNNNAIYKIEAR